MSTRLPLLFLLAACGNSDPLHDAGLPDVAEVAPVWTAFEVAGCEVEEIDRPRDLTSPQWISCGDGCVEWEDADSTVFAAQQGAGGGFLLLYERQAGFDVYKLVSLESEVIRAWRFPTESRCELAQASIYESALAFSISVSRDDSLREEHFYVVYIDEGDWTDGSRRVEGFWATSARKFGERTQPAITPEQSSDIRYFRGENLWELTDGTVFARFAALDARSVGRSPAHRAVLNIDSRVVVLAEERRLSFWHPSLEMPELLFEAESPITALEHTTRLVWATQERDETVVWRDAESGLAYRPEFINALLFEPTELYRSEIELPNPAAGNPIRGLLVSLVDSNTLRAIRDDCATATEPCVSAVDVEVPSDLAAEELIAVVAGPPVAALLRTERGMAVVDLVDGG